jgi:5-methylcytosine-specific restriction enzyme A
MPYAAPRICNRCRQLVAAGQPCDCRPPWEGSLQRAGRGRRRARWRVAKLKADPICQWVDEDGTRCRMVATTVDHIQPLAEGGDLWAWDNAQSLYREHDIIKTAADAQRGKRRARGHDDA